MLYVYLRDSEDTVGSYCDPKSLKSEISHQIHSKYKIIVILSMLIVLLLYVTIVSGSLRNLSDSY